MELPFPVFSYMLDALWEASTCDGANISDSADHLVDYFTHTIGLMKPSIIPPATDSLCLLWYKCIDQCSSS